MPAGQATLRLARGLRRLREGQRVQPWSLYLRIVLWRERLRQERGGVRFNRRPGLHLPAHCLRPVHGEQPLRQRQLQDETGKHLRAVALRLQEVRLRARKERLRLCRGQLLLHRQQSLRPGLQVRQIERQWQRLLHLSELLRDLRGLRQREDLSARERAHELRGVQVAQGAA